MTTLQAYGRLGRAPEQRTIATGKAMTTASMVVDLGRDEEASEWFSLLAFGAIGEALSGHLKDDMIAISGRLSKSTWIGKNGEERSGFSVLVDVIASARTARPGKPRPKREDAEVLHSEIPF